MLDKEGKNREHRFFGVTVQIGGQSSFQSIDER